MPTTTTLSGNQPAMSKLIRHKDPNTHLPRFETNNSMGHHCGVCGVPLTNPSCIRKCIGVHEAICPQFHPLFHRIGCVHKCKACKRQKEAVHSRHADIGLKIQELKSFSESRITAAAEKESWSPTVKVPKRERKLEKSAARAQLRAQASQNITTKYLGELASILYPTAEAEALLNQTFCDDFQKQDTDDQRIIDSIMAPMREKPNYDAEVNRVLRELKVIAGHSRQEKILHEKIVVAVKQDMVTTYNTYVNLYRRRTQYALWITKGAALNTAWGEEGWDPETGEKLASANIPVVSPESIEPELANGEQSDENPLSPTESIKDERRGGVVLKEAQPPATPISPTNPFPFEESTPEEVLVPKVLRLVLKTPDMPMKETGWAVVGKSKGKVTRKK